MLDRQIIILDKKISINELKKYIVENSNASSTPIIMESKIIVSIYNIIPLAILMTFEYVKTGGFSKWDLYSQTHKKIEDLFREMDPYKEKGIWGLFFDELQLNYITYYPDLKKLSVSIS